MVKCELVGNLIQQKHILSGRPCAGASGCLFVFDLHNLMKCAVFLKNHPSTDVESEGHGSEGIFPKLFGDCESSKKASPSLLAPMMVLSLLDLSC